MPTAHVHVSRYRLPQNNYSPLPSYIRLPPEKRRGRGSLCACTVGVEAPRPLVHFAARAYDLRIHETRFRLLWGCRAYIHFVGQFFTLCTLRELPLRVLIWGFRTPRALRELRTGLIA